jgi:hypothetical protein
MVETAGKHIQVFKLSIVCEYNRMLQKYSIISELPNFGPEITQFSPSFGRFVQNNAHPPAFLSLFKLEVIGS